jgi:hypothetical protein
MEDTTKSRFLAERTQIPNGESSFHGAACPPFSTNSNVGAGKSLPSRDRPSRGALRIAERYTWVALLERKYQQRLKVSAELQRRTGAPEITAAKPATALDHSRGLEAGFK